ncbi:MAG: YraN family protein [Anaerolineae bacterium]|nr:YraN family protein [Anaerolineae bacterium]
MDNRRQKLGQWGENLAKMELLGKGYVLLAQNWRCSRGEVDLIVQDGETMVFVEVKTRRGRDLGTPEDAITAHKARKLYTIAQTYLAEQESGDIPWRIDLVAVELDKQGQLLRCEHRENILAFGFVY